MINQIAKSNTLTIDLQKKMTTQTEPKMTGGKEHKTAVSSSVALSNKVTHESFHFLTFRARGCLQHLLADYQLHA